MRSSVGRASQVTPAREQTIDSDHICMVSTQIGGLNITTASRIEIVKAWVRDCLTWKQNLERLPTLVFDANGQGISLLDTNPSYRNAMSQADIVHADGGFIVFASRFIGKVRIRERSATTDMLHDFASAAVKNGLSFYLLGGTEEVNLKCKEVLELMYPGLRVIGRRNGYFSQSCEQSIIDEIRALRPDVLWVGLGKPKEQIFSAKWRNQLNACWIVTCGGCFNFVTGHYKRAPVWMQNMNLEWVHRAVSDPKRLLVRYITTSPHAVWVLMKNIR